MNFYEENCISRTSVHTLKLCISVHTLKLCSLEYNFSRYIYVFLRTRSLFQYKLLNNVRVQSITQDLNNASTKAVRSDRKCQCT